jgi:hypothetical protein
VDPFGCALAVSLAVAFAGGAPPAEDRPVETVMQDDALMLHGSEQRVRQTAQDMRSLGVDRVRLTASWFVIAPGRDQRARPQFDATDPNAYPDGIWIHLDRAVKAVVRTGMKPMLDVAFFAPRWAVKRGARNGDHRFKPSAAEFGRFAQAVGRRYSGGFDDPSDKGDKLPAVRLWTTWNEPNHGAFLLPQWERKPGSTRGWRPRSPHVYRRMHEAGYAALKGVSDRNRVLLGGTSFLGGTKPGAQENVSPLRFLRELACVDSRFRPLRRRECRGFRPLQADGYSHHPYSLYDPPSVGDPNGDNIRLADLGRLTWTLTQLGRRGRIAGRLPLYVTEYGYETNPPDTLRGVTLDQQASYLGEATYLAWRQPEVRMFAQFLLRDIGPDQSVPESSPRRWEDYQTGLVTHDGQAKPGLDAFKLPFWVERAITDGGEEGLMAFGQVRPGNGQRRMAIERLTEGTWSQVASVPIRGSAAAESCPSFATDSYGFFERFIPLGGGDHTLRAVWHRLDGVPVLSVPVKVRVDSPPTRVGALLRPPN